MTLDARDLSVYSQLLTRVIVDTNSVLGQQVSQCVTQNTAKFTAVLTAMNTAVGVGTRAVTLAHGQTRP